MLNTRERERVDDMHVTHFVMLFNKGQKAMHSHHTFQMYFDEKVKNKMTCYYDATKREQTNHMVS